jgi:hypothetical protein
MTRPPIFGSLKRAPRPSDVPEPPPAGSAAFKTPTRRRQSVILLSVGLIILAFGAAAGVQALLRL